MKSGRAEACGMQDTAHTLKACKGMDFLGSRSQVPSFMVDLVYALMIYGGMWEMRYRPYLENALRCWWMEIKA